MNIAARKIAFVQEFLRLESEEAINALEKLLQRGKIEQVEEEERFKPMTMEEYEARIDEALEDSKHGRMISHEAMVKKIEKWA